MRWITCVGTMALLGGCAFGGAGLSAGPDGGPRRSPEGGAGADGSAETALDAGRSDVGDVDASTDGAVDDGGEACGHRVCGGECVDVRLDPRHCGGCGAACGAGELCEEGACRVSPVEAWRVDYGLGAAADPGAERLYDVAVDASGRLYVVGWGRTARYLTPDALGAGFVEGFDLTGRSRFLHLTPVFEHVGARPLAVAVGADGRYYVAGTVQGPFAFDATHTAPSEAHSYVAAHDPDGTMRWLLASSMNAMQQLDLHGSDLYAALRHQDRPYTLGGVQLISDDHFGYDIYTVAMTTGGVVRWGRGALSSRANTLTAASDHVVRAGFERVYTGGGFSIERHALEVYDRDGEPLPGYRALDDHGGARGTAVAAGGGAVYVAVIGTDDAGWVIQRYVDRNLQWERQLGTSVALTDITVDDAGRVYAAGGVLDTVSFDGATRGAAQDSFVVALDATGATRWTWFHTHAPDAGRAQVAEVEVAGTLVYVWLEHGHGGASSLRALRQR